MIETTPSIKSILAILDPIILPNAISIESISIAWIVEANSGKLVPKATIVNPIKYPLTLKISAN